MYEVAEMARFLAVAAADEAPSTEKQDLGALEYFYSRQIRSFAATEMIEAAEIRGKGRTAARVFDYEALCICRIMSILVDLGQLLSTRKTIAEYFKKRGRRKWLSIINRRRNDFANSWQGSNEPYLIIMMGGANRSKPLPELLTFDEWLEFGPHIGLQVIVPVAELLKALPDRPTVS